MKKNYFCENLKCIRSSLNISQKEIADYLKLNPSSYSNYENGRREPGIDILINISNFLNIEIDKLLTENLFNNEEFLKNIEIKFLNDDLDYRLKILILIYIKILYWNWKNRKKNIYLLLIMIYHRKLRKLIA